MAGSKHPDWSRRLPRALTISGVVTLRTLADVRVFIRHLSDEMRAKETWRNVSGDLDDAARGGDVPRAAASLRIVCMLEGIECREK